MIPVGPRDFHPTDHYVLFTAAAFKVQHPPTLAVGGTTAPAEDNTTVTVSSQLENHPSILINTITADCRTLVMESDDQSGFFT